MALRALNKILTLVMEDLPEPDTVPHLILLSEYDPKPSIDPLGLSTKSKDEKIKFMESVNRTQSWLDAASKKLNICIKALVGLVKHSHFKVRKELVDFSSSLLLTCPR